MGDNNTKITTAMSRIGQLAAISMLGTAIAACSLIESHNAQPLLQGSFNCGGNLCNSGEMCQFHGYGIDAGVPPDGGADPNPTGPGGTYICAAVPAGCVIQDCQFDCSPCINELCYPTSAMSVTGRSMRCYGQ